MRTSQQTISILGCGWLGLPLAGHLLSIGHKVKGSFTSDEKKQELKKWAIEPFRADMTRPDLIDGRFFHSDTLIVTVPPSKGGKDQYPAFLEQILLKAKANGCKNVLFTSSTSVYPDSQTPITENSPVQEVSSRGNNMLAAERAIRSVFPETSTIVRLGGLIGPNRHPGRFLSGKSDVSGANVPVNYLTLEDGARIITELVTDERYGKTYNLVVPSHPTKEEFYSYACELKGIPVPGFDPATKNDGYKLVSGEQLTHDTGIEYLTADWKAYLKSL